MTRYGRSPWVERFPKSRLPAYPRFQGDRATQVVVVGGGLTGCLVAYGFAAAGVKVVLVEADRIGRGSTAGSLGWIAETPGLSFQPFERALGLRAARKAWQGWRRAALDFAALLRRLDVKCGLEPRTTLHLARTPEQAVRLKREVKSRQDAGLEASLVRAQPARQESGTETLAAVRTRDGATIDPFRAALGVIAAAEERGTEVFEQSPAEKVHFNAKGVEVTTGRSTLRADRVVVATGRPTPLFKALARHFWFERTYYALTEPIPSRIRRTLGESSLVTIDSAEPAHHIRWVDDDRLLVGGADTPTVAERHRERVIVQRTGQLMYELSTLYPDISGLPPSHGWDAVYGRTADGLPYIGPHRNYPRHLFAFGCGRHSVTDAYLASRLLLRQYHNEIDPADEVFGFTTERLQ